MLWKAIRQTSLDNRKSIQQYAGVDKGSLKVSILHTSSKNKL